MKKLKVTLETLKLLSTSEEKQVVGASRTTTGAQGPKSIWG